MTEGTESREQPQAKEERAPRKPKKAEAGGTDAAGPSAAAAGAPGAEVQPAGGDDQAAKPAPVVRKVKAHGGRVPPIGIAFIKATFNNTLVSITDMNGSVVSWSSAGRAGFKGARKSTAFAATIVAQDAARQAASKGMHEVEVRVQGAGSGRESAIRAIQSAGLSVSVIKDVTPIPHNGCRPRKRRRV